MTETTSNKQLFVPLTDELLYDKSADIGSKLLPFNVEFNCLHWLKVVINPEDDSIPA